MGQPSTAWREQIDPGAEARYQSHAEQLGRIQAAKSAKYGPGRFLHRKPVLALAGSFEVLPNPPPHAAHGIFAAPGRYRAIARLSNGGMEVQADSKPDVRGFAFKVAGIAGPAALGGTADHQDFLLINHESFAARTSDEFVGILPSVAKGPAALLWFMVRKFGLGAGLGRLKLLAKTLGKPFVGFAAESFNTAVPFAVGPYAAKLRIAPVKPVPAGGKDHGADMRAQIAKGPIVYDLGLQFFTDEATTPIEDPTKVWPQDQSPFLTVARLTLDRVAEDVEKLRFDPWGGLAAHRPLGEIMRARKAYYFASQKARGAV